METSCRASRPRWWIARGLTLGILAVGIAQAFVFGDRFWRASIEERDTKMWRGVIWNLPTGYAVVDCKTGAVIDWNPAAEEITGWRADEVVGKVFTFLVPDNYLQNHLLWLDGDYMALLRRDETVDRLRNHLKLIDCTIKTKDGQLVPVRLSLRIAELDRPAYLVTIDRQDSILHAALPEPEVSREAPTTPTPTDAPVFQIREGAGRKQPFNYAK